MKMTEKIKLYLKDRLFFTLAVNLTALLSALLLFRPFFEENDDSSIALIAEGAFGQRSPYLIYTNILYGRLLSLLYALVPSVRWHSVLQYIFAFLALCAITWLLAGYKGGRALSCLILLSSFYEVYVSLQYSKISMLSALSGYLLLISHIRGRTCSSEAGPFRPKTPLIIGFILIIFGFILREDGFLLASIFALIIIAADFLSLLISKKKAARYFKGCVAVFAPVFVVIICLFALNLSAYKKIPEWDSFISYNNIRTDLIDYRYDLLDYEAYGEELSRLGVSENDAFLYLTWQFGDDSVFTVEKMQEILHAPFAQNRIPGTDMAKSFIKHIYDDILLFDPAFLGFIAIVCLCLIKASRIRGEKILILPLMLTLAALIFIMCFYEYSGRWSHRIVFAGLLAAIFALSFEIASFGKDPFDGSDRNPAKEALAEPLDAGLFRGALLVSAVMVSVSVFSACLGNHFERNSFLRNEPRGLEYLYSLKDHKERLYIADTFTFQNCFKYEVFKAMPEGSLDNFVTVASWYVNSPVTKGILGRYGYENPYDALKSADEAVILVDNMTPDKKIRFLNEHYGGGFSLKPLGESLGFMEYRIVKEN